MHSPSLERRLRLHIQGPLHPLRAICHPGFEAIVASELRLLGIEDVRTDFGAVEFSAKFSIACALQARLRTVSRLVLRLKDWHAENFGQLEKGLASIPWELWLPGGCSPELDVTCHKSRLYHSDAVAERAKSLITQKLFLFANPEPGVALQPQRVFLRLSEDRCFASLDLSGTLLYKRGYDRHVEDAPLRETMAASMLLGANFSRYTTLLDPMAGSGTFSLEAAQWLHGPCPGELRSFSCQEQPAYKAASFAHALKNAQPLFPQSNLGVIRCGDKNAKACATINRNAEAGRVSAYVQADNADFFALPPSPPGSLLVLNPPYGIRLRTDALSLFKEIGKKIRQDFSQSAYALMSPSPACTQALGLSHYSVIQTLHGGLKVEILFKG